MVKFTYTAKSAEAGTVRGTVEAETRDAAVKKLRSDGLYPLSMFQEQRQGREGRRTAIGSKSLTSFTRNLADLVRSGFTVMAALDALAKQEQHRTLKALIERLKDDIGKGMSFSGALSFHPSLFSSFYVNMAKIGEASGKLDQALERLAEFREKQDELSASIRSALAYPIFLLSMGIVTVFALMVFFVPRLAGLFADFNQTLPLSTTIIMKTSEFASAYWWLWIIGAIVALIGAQTWKRSEEHKVLLDSLALKVPLARALIQKMEVSRLSHSLGVLLQNGVPMMQALSIAPLTVSNRLYRRTVGSFAEMVRRGGSLSSCFRGSQLFPTLFSTMAAVGEESGELPQMLQKAAAVYESELARSLKTIVSLLEPVLVLLVGGIVVFIVFSILLPVFSLSLLSA